ncbi:MAG: hypothetical protein CME65_12340 [Halobacteriovoraceae bacterium]|nr:hypothetical protein [Halobacteriovoraceae bacterium]|tara:strand:- start:15415 stop:15714 length:300 start_codon:yes stop_codon:yes gene_type:complete
MDLINTLASNSGLIMLAAGIAIGVAALGGTMGQGKAASAALEGIARNPEAQGKILIPLVIAMALIESLVILAFVIANTIAGEYGTMVKAALKVGGVELE